MNGTPDNLQAYKLAVCHSLRLALETFLSLQDVTSDRAHIDAAGRLVSRLTRKLEMIEREEKRGGRPMAA